MNLKQAIRDRAVSSMFTEQVLHAASDRLRKATGDNRVAHLEALDGVIQTAVATGWSPAGVVEMVIREAEGQSLATDTRMNKPARGSKETR